MNRCSAMPEDERALLPVLYTTIRTSGNPLDMVIVSEERVEVRTANNVDPPFSSTSFFTSPQTSSPSPESPHSFQIMLFSSLFLTLAACAIGFTSAAVTPHGLVRRSPHHGALQPFQKRASGQFTYFAVGMGACGKQNTDDDFVSVPLSFAAWPLILFVTDCRTKHSSKSVIAVSDPPFADACEQSWAGGSHCFETVTITINGKTARAQVVDRVCRIFCSFFISIIDDYCSA